MALGSGLMLARWLLAAGNTTATPHDACCDATITERQWLGDAAVAHAMVAAALPEQSVRVQSNWCLQGG
jgi:hypothetical protein